MLGLPRGIDLSLSQRKIKAAKVFYSVTQNQMRIIPLLSTSFLFYSIIFIYSLEIE